MGAKYLKPKSVVELQKNPPSEKNELENEIKKQQFLLEHLHGQVQQMREERLAERTAKEETMWEVQAAITMLKRRLKTLNEKGQRHDGGEGEEGDGKVTGGTADGGTEADIPSPEDEQSTTDFVLLEKQLLAVQTTLRDEIAEEKRLIAQLLSILRELHSKLPEEEQNKMSESQRQKYADENHKNSLNAPKNEDGPFAQNLDKESEEDGKWGEWCKAEEHRRDRLLGELIRYRKICSQLRARLEHDTALIALLQQQKHTDEAPPATANLLVTRF
ncbi:hypothetical protein niasHS_017672 [Heterodera schachtii]|uniref:Uncharacterized protein n=1 Tax=Heterodera schachtii TaxID=97005 RepID=A0ABD2I973_HETSC